MKIISLTAENVKKIKAVRITPDGNVVVIRGNNAQGKSSVLDAIQYGLGGGRAQPSEVIRRGEEHARVVLELDDIIVERIWKEKGPGRLEVKTKSNGRPKPSPQKLLDELVGKLSFDPLAFLQMKPREQVGTLKELLGLDFDELDSKREDLYADRTVLGRELTKAQATHDEYANFDNVPDKTVSIDALLKKHEEAVQQKAANEQLRRAFIGETEDIKRQEKLIANLQQELKGAKSQLVKLKKSRVVTEDSLKDLTHPDIEFIAAQLSKAADTNKIVSEKLAWAERHQTIKKLAREVEDHTEEIVGIDTEKKKRIAAVEFPVEGLGFTADAVTFNDIELTEASQAEKLRVSLAMGLALNPKLKIILIREGSLLDEDSTKLVAEMAAEADAQVWIEIVGTEGGGIVIEDGELASGSQPAVTRESADTPLG